MSNTAIKVENLSKRYRIGLKKEIHDTMVGAVTDFIKRPIKNLKRLRKLSTFSKNGNESEDIIWALKDVSFEVKQGEVVGIIGRNGSGKSTLLKIISHITEPTSGSVTFNGRVSSLLEVGTGFHPELTGRENVYLNGTILGMSKTEIGRKFDEIIAFSEVERFLDTPVKRYSSGMKVRLAFAVAAHLEPEILLVDEVLAVGDAEFQKKCLGKMDNIASEGRTVLFVSHNLPSISALCDSAIWIEQGRIQMIDKAESAIQSYLASCRAESGHEGVVAFDDEDNSKDAYIQSIELKNSNNEISSRFDVLSPVFVNIGFCCRRRFLNWRIFVSVARYDGVTIFSTTTWDYNTDRKPISPGEYLAQLEIPRRFLGESSYLITVAFGEPPEKKHDVHENVLRFEMTGEAFDYGRNIGFLAYPFDWQVQNISN